MYNKKGIHFLNWKWIKKMSVCLTSIYWTEIWILQRILSLVPYTTECLCVWEFRWAVLHGGLSVQYMNLCTCLCFRLSSTGKGCVNNYYARKSLGYFWFLSVSCCSFRILFTSVFASICIFMETNITMCTCKCIPIWTLFFFKFHLKI